MPKFSKEHLVLRISSLRFSLTLCLCVCVHVYVRVYMCVYVCIHMRPQRPEGDTEILGLE